MYVGLWQEKKFDLQDLVVAYSIKKLRNKGKYHYPSSVPSHGKGRDPMIVTLAQHIPVSGPTRHCLKRTPLMASSEQVEFPSIGLPVVKKITKPVKYEQYNCYVVV